MWSAEEKNGSVVGSNGWDTLFFRRVDSAPPPKADSKHLPWWVFGGWQSVPLTGHGGHFFVGKTTFGYETGNRFLFGARPVLKKAYEWEELARKTAKRTRPKKNEILVPIEEPGMFALKVLGAWLESYGKISSMEHETGIFRNGTAMKLSFTEDWDLNEVEVWDGTLLLDPRTIVVNGDSLTEAARRCWEDTTPVSLRITDLSLAVCRRNAKWMLRRLEAYHPRPEPPEPDMAEPSPPESADSPKEIE